MVTLGKKKRKLTTARAFLFGELQPEKCFSCQKSRHVSFSKLDFVFKGKSMFGNIFHNYNFIKSLFKI